MRKVLSELSSYLVSHLGRDDLTFVRLWVSSVSQVARSTQSTIDCHARLGHPVALQDIVKPAWVPSRGGPK